jgi:dephospho-CoA kinase
MSLIIGLTGGIGSGKTVASDYFASLGITVVDADIAARIVVERGQPALEKINRHFGNNILTDSGDLNRAKLREKIFSDPAEKKWLEQLLHPLIREEIQTQLRNSTSAYTLLVSPLLIETDQYLLANRVLLIDAPESEQVQRTTQRDNNSADQVEAIMANQASRDVRKNKADDIIINDSTLESLYKKIDQQHTTYLKISSE